VILLIPIDNLLEIISKIFFFNKYIKKKQKKQNNLKYLDILKKYFDLLYYIIFKINIFIFIIDIILL
jgi:hypothetical protein